jgi:mannose-6-phosphate isomerase-like protein (cupin superfamily)
MLDTLIIFDNEAPVEIHGGEDGSGPLFWKRFVGAPDMHGDWESFEYARLPSGGVIGEHVHHRTEEIYFVTKGRATMVLDGVAHVVGPGDLILTPLNGQHRATVDQGDDEWEFIVAEVLPPEVLGSGDPTEVKRPTKIRNLEREDVGDMSEVFSGPWSRLEVRTIPAGEMHTFKADDEEFALYVVSGRGTIKTDLNERPLAVGQGLAIPKGGNVSLTAGADELKLFVVGVAL